MQFSTSSALVLLASLASFVTADLHYKAICVDTDSGYDIYNANATTAACAAYLAAPTGSNTWDSCPDCYMVTGGSPPYCNSDAEHMGGDQITSYCQAAGADNALTS